MSSIPGSGRSPGEGHGIPLQYSCLENSIDRGAWWVIVHGIAKSWTELRYQTTTKIKKQTNKQTNKNTLKGERTHSKTMNRYTGISCRKDNIFR